MRVRFRFSKLGKVRFTSHRDVARAWERALRRAELPVALTEGFSPRAKVHFGLALPTAHESLGEYLDVDFRDDPPVDVAGLPALLTPLLPDGITVDLAVEVSVHQTSLQQAVTSCSWTIQAVGLDLEEAEAAMARLLAAETLPVTRQRKGKDVTDDIRPYILHLALTGPLPDVRSPSGDHTIAPSGVELDAELGTQPRGLRPAELIEALGSQVSEGRVRRNQQWITLDGARHEPLPADATSTAHATARAS
jgi:radical SAM-linked protein